MIPLQFSCHNNDHTAQLSLHTHTHTQVHVGVIDSRHTHLNTRLFSHATEEGCTLSGEARKGRKQGKEMRKGNMDDDVNVVSQVHM